MTDPASWKSRTAIFLGTQLLLMVGTALVQYTLLWYVTLQTKSGVMMTLFTVCAFLPTFLLSPFAGVWADRFDRKKIIMAADGIIAVVTLALAFAFMAGQKSLWLILVAAALRAVGTALQAPAVGAILPQLVPADQLMRVNGISGTLQSAVTLVSPMLSGALMSLFPIQVVFFADLATAVIAMAVLFFFLEVPPVTAPAPAARPSSFQDLKLGIAYVREHRSLVPYFSFLAVAFFLISPGAFLTPLQIARTYGSDVWRLSAMEVAFSVGMLAGGLTMSTWGGFRNRMHTILAAAGIIAVLTVVLGLAPPFPLYLATMALYGITIPAFNASSAVIVQTHVEPEYLGRVFSILTMISTSIMPLGMLLFGPLAEVVRIEWLLLATGVLMAAGTLVSSGNRRLVAVGETPAPQV